MQTDFSGDPINSDKLILDAQAERPGRPIRLRIQPQVLRAPKKGAGGMYTAWKDNTWTVDCGDAKEVFALRTAMRAFFQALGRGGVEAVVAALQLVGKEADRSGSEAVA